MTGKSHSLLAAAKLSTSFQLNKIHDNFLPDFPSTGQLKFFSKKCPSSVTKTGGASSNHTKEDINRIKDQRNENIMHPGTDVHLPGKPCTKHPTERNSRKRRQAADRICQRCPTDHRLNPGNRNDLQPERAFRAERNQCRDLPPADFQHGLPHPGNLAE